MPPVQVVDETPVAPERVLEGARDFSERRAEMWPDVHVEHLQVGRPRAVSRRLGRGVVYRSPALHGGRASRQAATPASEEMFAEVTLSKVEGGSGSEVGNLCLRSIGSRDRYGVRR